MSEKVDISKQLEDLTVLYEITKQLASSLELRDCLEKTMHILAEMKDMENGTVTIVNPLTGKQL